MFELPATPVKQRYEYEGEQENTKETIEELKRRLKVYEPLFESESEFETNSEA